jgi:hypothetical protein
MDEFMVVGQKDQRFFFSDFFAAMEKALSLFHSEQKEDVSVCKKMSKDYHRRWYQAPAWDWKKQYAEDPEYKTVCRLNWENRQGIYY